MRFHHYPRLERATTRGVSLLELMVGLTIGLIVAIAATGSLVYMQSSGRTVSEATRMQQDATLAFDTLGRFLRSAGSVGLVPASGDSVTFTPQATYSALGPLGNALQGDSASSFRTAHPSGPNGVNYDCQGNGPLAAGTLITSFEFTNGQLRCVVNGTAHVLIDGVQQLVVHYGVRDAAGSLQYRSFANNIPWAEVQSLRLCLVMVSRTPVPEFADLFKAGSTLSYPDCNGANIAASIAADNLLRRRYTHVFSVRPGI
jgi:type IV pilus assembly protein PilW